MIPRAQLTRLQIISHAARQAASCESANNSDGALRLIAALGDLSPEEHAALRNALREHRCRLHVRRDQYAVR